jgi:hypothetical protein
MDIRITGNLTKIDLRTHFIEELYFICDFEKETFGWKEGSYSDYFIEIFGFGDFRDCAVKTYEKKYGTGMQKVFQFTLEIGECNVVLTTNNESEFTKWSSCFTNILNGFKSEVESEDVELEGDECEEDGDKYSENNNVDELDVRFKRSQIYNKLSGKKSTIKEESLEHSEEYQCKEIIVFNDSDTQSEAGKKKAKTESFKANRIGVTVKESSSKSLAEVYKGRGQIILNASGLKNLISDSLDSSVNSGGSKKKKELFITDDFLNWNYYDKNLKVIIGSSEPRSKLEIKSGHCEEGTKKAQETLAVPKYSIAGHRKAVKSPTKALSMEVGKPEPAKKELVENIITIKYNEEEQRKPCIKKLEEAKYIETKSPDSTLCNTRCEKIITLQDEDYETLNTVVDIDEGNLSDASNSSLRSNGYENILRKKLRNDNCSDDEDCDEIQFKKKHQTVSFSLHHQDSSQILEQIAPIKKHITITNKPISKFKDQVGKITIRGSRMENEFASINLKHHDSEQFDYFS